MALYFTTNSPRFFGLSDVATRIIMLQYLFLHFEYLNVGICHFDIYSSFRDSYHLVKVEGLQRAARACRKMKRGVVMKCVAILE